MFYNHPLFFATLNTEVGDCLGGLQFTHLAGYQGALAAFNAVQGIQMPGPKPSAATGTLKQKPMEKHEGVATPGNLT